MRGKSLKAKNIDESKNGPKWTKKDKEKEWKNAGEGEGTEKGCLFVMGS